MTAPTISTQPRLFAGADSIRPAHTAVREIVFASDLSSASDRAFDHARLLAEGFGAHLVLYYALEVAHGTTDPAELETRHRVQRAAREHLERRAEGVSVATGVRVERCPSVSDALVSYLRAARPDLVVMGTRGRSGLAHLMLGSVAERVLQQTRMPTLCVREPEHGVALPYRRILVPTDLSPSSRRALPLAAALGRTFDAEVLAVHIADVRVHGATWGITTLMEDRLPAEQDVEAFVRAEMPDVRVRARVELGSVCDAVTRVAAEEHADVIVISTHGEDSVADRLQGSHAERIVRQSPCPVLVV
jgi:nucleotide-binding universal stress UspA family protein